MLLSYNRLVLKYIGKCCFILLQRAKPPTMETSATGNFATKRSQILNGHALNICINKTFEKKAKNRMKTAHNVDKCNKKLSQQTACKYRTDTFLTFAGNKTFEKKAKKQNENRPLQKNKGVSPDKIDTIRQVLFLPPFKAAERKVIIK